MPAPRVFISYSHDSKEHKEWTNQLAADLRKNGIDVTLDQWDLSLGQDISLFMQNGIANSDKVLLICTENYVRKSEVGKGGVGFERLIVTAEVVQSIDTNKFIPIIVGQVGEPKVPKFLGPRLYSDFRDPAARFEKLEELCRALLGKPFSEKPPLGTATFSGVPTSEVGTQKDTGIARSGKLLLSGKWFEDHATAAHTALKKGKHPGSMELRFGLHAPINKSQLELYRAVSNAEITTFGWPIAVLIDSQESLRPHPYIDGIKAELDLTLNGGSARNSYDYWTMRNDGDFYLLQSLFEDQRGSGKLFFNTRIVRIAEAFMFASTLYSNLGVAPEAKLNIRVTHEGLSRRTLDSSNPLRSVLPSKCNAPAAESEITLSMGQLRSELVENVIKICEPLFMLFNFANVPRPVYEDIVTRFEKGDVS